MVQDGVFLFGIVVGSLLTLAYMGVAFARKGKPQLHNVVILYLCAAGVAAGGKVCLLACQSTVLQALNHERLYVFIGGLAVIWVSVISLAQPFLPAEPGRAGRKPRSRSRARQSTAKA